ncbi:MAG TPA: GNAT family N-acetyltransferase, partial [Gemmataceae bacterium]|nr:GNAT family N-acetyltransferase [Gemmataceae bacterium]
FRLVFQHVAAADREARVTNAVRMVESGELDRAGILAAHLGSQLLGVLVCLPVPGASGLVWPPQVQAGPWQAAVEDELVQHAASWLQSRGAKLAQSLLNPADAHLARPLERNGFRHITSLWYLRCKLDAADQDTAGESSLEFRTFRDTDQRLFEQTLLRSYEGTLDCPEVNDVRTLDEILTGHRAQGSYSPDRWWLALHGDEPVGVLLLAEVPEWNSWDVSYVGVVPDARRRGFGRELMTKAFREARRAKAGQLTLSIDARNQPAWQLYRALGFQQFEKREVFLAIWRRAG